MTQLLLLHGFGSDAEHSWGATGWTAALDAAGIPWFAPDLPGHGRGAKSHDPESYGIDGIFAALSEALDSQGYEQVDVLGYSLGGDLALRFASSRPDRVRRVVAGGVRTGKVFTPEMVGSIRSHITSGADFSDPLAAEVWAGATALTDNDEFALLAFAQSLVTAPPLMDAWSFVGPTMLFRGADDELADGLEAFGISGPDATELVLPARHHRSTLSARALKVAVRTFLDGSQAAHQPTIEVGR